MERTNFFLFFLFLLQIGETVTTLETNCLELGQTKLTEIGSGNITLSRVKRSFGGQEPINFTLVNSQILGPPGFLSITSGSTLDLIFQSTGFAVLGIFYCFILLFSYLDY
jgi:hypothetical protein